MYSYYPERIKYGFCFEYILIISYLDMYIISDR